MSIQKTFREYSVAMITGLAIVLLAIIFGYYIWGVNYLVTTEDAAELRNTPGGQTPQFDLDAAQNLDYRGAPPASGN